MTTLAGPGDRASRGPDPLRHAATFGPGYQPADPFFDPHLRLPPQQLLGLGGPIAQRGLRGGGYRARLLLVDGLEGRARQPQQDLGNLVERGVDPGSDHEALARDRTGHRHNRDARDVADINIVVPFAAIARQDRRLAGFDPLIGRNNMEGIHAAVVLALAIHGGIAQRHIVKPVALLIQAQQVLADDLLAA